jgi:hypothetical protein
MLRDDDEEDDGKEADDDDDDDIDVDNDDEGGVADYFTASDAQPFSNTMLAAGTHVPGRVVASFTLSSARRSSAF